MLAPGFAAKRARAQLDLERVEYARAALARVGARRRDRDEDKRRIYDAASGGRRLAGWAAAADSGEVMESMLEILRLRSRDLVRNNPYAAAAVGAIVSNAVGTGIQARLPGAPKTTQAAWRRWAESTDCDYAGRHDLYGIQRMVMRSVVESGEVFVIKRVHRDGLSERSGRVAGFVPLQLQVLEAEYLATSVTKGSGDNRVQRGIEYDSDGRAVAYHFYVEHPGTGFFGRVETRRWLAADVAHIFRQDRPGQSRGVPWGAPVMTRLNALDDYEDAQLERQRIAACYAVFVHDSTDDDDRRPGREADGGSKLSERVEPGMIERLPPGTDVRFTAPAPVSDYAEYVAANLRAISAGYGTPYEVLSGDLSKTSFASARIGWLEFDRRLKAWRRDIMHCQFLGTVWGWWSQLAGIMGLRTNTTPEWTPPRREMLNPAEDVKTAIMRIRGGLASWSEVIREHGNDPESVAQEIADDAVRFDKLEIVLDSDPRRTTQSGQQQASAGETNEEASPAPEEEPAAAE